MSRSGYGEDIDSWELIKWRGAVTSAIKGRRGQAFLKEMLAALDALPEKRLIASELQTSDLSSVCAMGAVGKVRGIDMSKLDPEDRESVAGAFGIAPALAAEIAFENDEAMWVTEGPEDRFIRMRKWIVDQILPDDELIVSEANK